MKHLDFKIIYEKVVDSLLVLMKYFSLMVETIFIKE